MKPFLLLSLCLLSPLANACKVDVAAPSQFASEHADVDAADASSIDDVAVDSAADAAPDSAADADGPDELPTPPDGDAQDASGTSDGDTATDTDADSQWDADIDTAEPDTTPLCDPAACDDGNPCTDDGCDKASGCAYLPNTATCTDGDACTVGDLCQLGACSPGETKFCDDSNTCTDDSCDKASGCAYLPNTATCTDGDSCTTGDTCGGGACLAGAATKCDDGNPCTDDGCDKASGCLHVNNSLPCKDDTVCNGDEVCAGGVCQAGIALDCDDNNVCTDDSCDKAAGCLHANNTLPCKDDTVCNGDEVCGGGVCGAGITLDCDDKNVCTDDSCDKSAGCLHANNSLPCKDGTVCNGDEVCGGGVCGAGITLDCDDNNVCTDDSCDKAAGCLHANNSLPCKDDTICNGDEVCGGGACQAGITLDCDDKNVCTDDSCDKAAGCLHGNNSLPCKDDTVCNGNEVCGGGVCKAGSAPVCDDGNTCTDDSCDNANGCVYLPNSATCSDGNDCTLGEICVAGACKQGQPRLFNKLYKFPAVDIVSLPDGGVARAGPAFELQRLDATGTEVWASAASPNAGTAYSVAHGKSGYAVAGQSKETGNWKFKVVGSSEAGSPAWTTLLGNVAWARALVATEDGGYAVAGGQSAATEALLVRLDATGKVLWSQAYGSAGAGDEEAYAVAAVPASVAGGSGFVLGGLNSAKGAGKWDIWLVRTDANGQQLWDRTFGGVNFDVANSVVILPDGFLLAGARDCATSDWNGGGKIDASCNAVVMRLSSQGDVLWEKTYAVGNLDAFTDVTYSGGFAVLTGIRLNVPWLVRLNADSGSGSLAVELGASYGGPAAHLAAFDNGYAISVLENLEMADLWGKISCGNNCAQKPLDCDDKNPCTLDGCDGGKGCTNANAVDGVACEDGQACTVAGACAAGLCKGGSPKYFSTTTAQLGGGPIGLLPTTDGGIVMAGYLPGAPGEAVAWAGRVTAAGAKTWTQTWKHGGATLNALNDVTAMPDGGYLLSGSVSPGDKGAYDAWLVKTDGAGNKQWDATYGGANWDAFYQCVPVAGGSAVCVGYNMSAGPQQAWVVAVDKAGAKIWEYLTTEAQGLDSLVVQPSGNIIAVGYASVAGKADFFVLALSPSGKKVWSKTFGGAADDLAIAVAQFPSGDLAILGWTESFGAGGMDWWVVRTDGLGNKRWDKTYGGSANDQARSHALSVLADGGLLMAGDTSSKGAGGEDVWVIRTDPAGTVLWDRIFGSSAHEWGDDVAVLPNGGLAIVSREMGLIRMDPWGHMSCAEAGTCTGTTVADCDDGNPCTADGCDSKNGCSHGVLLGGAPCTDGLVCTANDGCQSASGIMSCVGMPVHSLCEDGNPCTINTCDGKAGCTVSIAPPTTNCTPVDSCLGPGKCEAGVCKGSGERLGAWPVPSLVAAYSIKPDGNTGYLVAGRDASGVGRVVRMDNGLATTWSTSMGISSLLYDARRAPDGSILAAGGTENGKTMLVARLGADGKLLATWTYAGGYCGQLHDVIPLADGGFVAGGQHCPTGNPRYFGVLRADSAGKQLWYNSDLLRNDSTLHSLSQRADGALTGAASNYRVLFNLAGEVWLQAPLATEKWGEYHGSALGSDGTQLLVGGFSTANNAYTAYNAKVTVVDSQGNLGFSADVASPTGTNAFLRSVVRAEDGSIIAAGDDDGWPGSNSRAWVVRLDKNGNTLLSNVVGPAKSAINDAVAVGASGYLFSAENGSLISTDAFGNATCTASGPCAAKSTTDCADTNPCTTDLCDAAHNGCYHTNLPDGASCGGTKLCKSGACQ